MVTADNKSREYGDANPTFTASYAGFKNGETLATSGVTGGPSLTTTATPTSSVSGSPYTITAALGTLAAGNYTFTFVNGQLTVTKATLTVTADSKTRTYGDANPTFTASYGSFKNGETLATSGVTGSPSLTTTATPTSPVSGSPYTITAALGTLAAANYRFTFVNGQLTVLKRDASVTPDAKSKTYGDADPTLTGTLSGFVAADSVAATYSRTAGETVAGSPYTISATLSPPGVLGNYTITYNTAAFTITPRPASVTPNAASKIYGYPDAALTGTLSGFVAADNVTATYSRTTGETVAGSPYTISATLSPAGILGNYDITYNTANFTITARQIAVTADAKTKVYGNADPALTYQITSGTLVVGDSFTGALTRVTGEAVGTYAIQQGTLALSSNYVLTYVGANLTITARPITVTADAKTKVYGNADPALTYQITSGSLAVSDTVHGALARVAGENVGTYPIQHATLALNANDLL